jgi:hypothetical protein
MSPPSVWGPAVWKLFHTLCEKIHEDAYNYIGPQLFFFIVRICKLLPCPECSKDASIFLAKIKMSDLKTKTELINIFYLFHNYVSAKKRKPLYNYANMNIYKYYRIVPVINNFIANYNTKGNMNLIAESFQRELVIKDFKRWISLSMKAFLPVTIPQPISIIKDEPTTEKDETVTGEKDETDIGEKDETIVIEDNTNLIDTDKE